MWVKPKIPKNTQHTRKYPKYLEIPKSKKDTRKYPIVFFVTPTRPEPDPLPGILSNTRPDPILKNPTRWALRGEHQIGDLKHSIYDSKHFFVTQNTLFVNQMTKNTLFYGIITYAHGEHGEHDSGSAQDWRTLSDLWRLLSALPVKPL